MPSQNAYSRFQLKGNPIPGSVFFSEVVNLGVVDPDVVVAVVAVVEVVLEVVVVAVILAVGLWVDLDLSTLTSIWDILTVPDPRLPKRTYCSTSHLHLPVSSTEAELIRIPHS